MRRLVPLSFLFFAVVGGTFLLQTIPVVGLFLMFLWVSPWTAILVNFGMIGTAVEAWTGRVSRLWLVLPIAFYGGYWTAVAREQVLLWRLGTTYDAENAAVSFAFDPSRAVLVDGGTWLVRTHGLPVAYATRSSHSVGFVAQRLVERPLCGRILNSHAARAASVFVDVLSDPDDPLAAERPPRFCIVSMPETPPLPMVRVTQSDRHADEGGLSLIRVTTTITGAGGDAVHLRTAYATPLAWVPMPMAGCGLNDMSSRWECTATFVRRDPTPITSGTGRYGSPREILARTLGLRPVPPAERRPADSAVLATTIAAMEEETVAHQLASIDAMITDPVDESAHTWETSAVAARPEALSARAEALVAGLERAAAAVRDDRRAGRRSGLVLAGLIARLPSERLSEFAPRLVALCSLSRENHWFWEAYRLIGRLGDLGSPALPCLIDPRGSHRSIDEARIEGLCRLGPPGRDAAEPELRRLASAATGPRYRDTRAGLYVAMRRLGMAPPAPDAADRAEFADLEREWADVSPTSPPSVCSISEERDARRQETQGSGTRGYRP